MMEWKRLDPLANAGPYQRLVKMPVKSFTLTEAQFNRIRETRPELIASEGESAVIGFPYRDYLEIHYGFPETELFRDRFAELFEQAARASNKIEAPRGVVLSFRDRPNRSLADTVFWSTTLEDGPQWVEMNWIAAPEQPEPESTVGAGYSIKPATDADGEALARLDGEASGQPPLTPSGVASLFANARGLFIVHDAAGQPVAYLMLRTEPGGWGVIQELAVRSGSEEALREPLLRWAIAWLRNNGGRRQRRRVFMDNAELALLRGLGFSPGETGLDYTRAVDPADITKKIDDRQAHGSVIRFGNWR